MNQTNIDSGDTNANSSDVRLPFNRYVIFFSLMILGSVTDLVTKSYIFNRYYDVSGAGKDPVWFVGENLGIQCSTNPGALFGMGSGYSWLFATISVFAVTGLLCWLFLFKAAIDRWITVSIGLICGGIIGNFYDRVGLGWRPEYLPDVKTHVRDWIHFCAEGVPFCDPWPNFNIADSLLVTGAIMLFIHAFFHRAEGTKAVENSEVETV